VSLIGPAARIAVTRPVSAAMQRCELTHLRRISIDIGLAREQHRAYVQLLRELGCRIESLPEEPGLADSVFVEDTAIVLDELASSPGRVRHRAEPRHRPWRACWEGTVS